MASHLRVLCALCGFQVVAATASLRLGARYSSPRRCDVNIGEVKMEKEKSPLLQSIILCFNPNFYRRVLRQSGWRSFLYLGLICLIVYGFLGYRFATIVFEQDEESISAFYERALPDFHFDNGEADYPPDKPHVYEEKVEEKDGEKLVAVIVDTSGKREELDEKYQAGYLITKTEIVTKGAAGRERREAIPKTAKKVPAKEFFISVIREQKPRAVVTMTLQAYLFHVIAKLILVALVSGVLLLADKGKAHTYPFAYYFNVGCYAVTPFVLSAFVRWGLRSSIANWVSYGVSLMLFLSLAVSGLAKCRQDDARELQLAEAQEDA